jgi:hypothetical protein
LFWVGSFLWGTFGPKERIGVDYLKKRLRQLNVDPRQIDPDVLLEFVSLALVSAHMSPRRPMKYDATEYKRELEWHADLIRAWVGGEKLDSTSEQLIKMVMSKAAAKKQQG